MNEGGRLMADRYRLLEKIGEGGAAEVFRARDQRLDRIVAVKLLRPQYTHDQASRQRFIHEAKTSASLSHANIVDIYDFGEGPDGSMFIAMQYIEGQNLKDILQKRGRLTAEETISITRQACYALSAAHARDMIHRDVKPQNIMIDRKGNAHLTDFGIVKALSGPSLTQSGMTFGTAAYMSPEQATGAPVGPASDIYSLGCVMYEALAGTPPFLGDNPAVVAYKQVWEQPRPLHDLVPEVPPSLENVVMRCLNKDPEQALSRYGGACRRAGLYQCGVQPADASRIAWPPRIGTTPLRAVDARRRETSGGDEPACADTRPVAGRRRDRAGSSRSDTSIRQRSSAPGGPAGQEHRTLYRPRRAAQTDTDCRRYNHPPEHRLAAYNAHNGPRAGPARIRYLAGAQLH
jgi:serine/threonine protein kinase